MPTSPVPPSTGTGISLDDIIKSVIEPQDDAPDDATRALTEPWRPKATPSLGRRGTGQGTLGRIPLREALKLEPESPKYVLGRPL